MEQATAGVLYRLALCILKHISVTSCVLYDTDIVGPRLETWSLEGLALTGGGGGGGGGGSVMLGPRLSLQAEAGGGGHAERTLPFCLNLSQDNLCAR